MQRTNETKETVRVLYRAMNLYKTTKKKKKTNKSTTHFLKGKELLCGGVWQSSLENKKNGPKSSTRRILRWPGGQPRTNAAQHGLTSVIGLEPGTLPVLGS